MKIDASFETHLKAPRFHVLDRDRTRWVCPEEQSHIGHPHEHFEVPNIDLEGNLVEFLENDGENRQSVGQILPSRGSQQIH